MSKTDQRGPLKFAEMIRSEEQGAPKANDTNKNARMRELRNAMQKLRGEATNANMVVLELKGAMARAKGNFKQAYAQTATDMKQRLESIRNELQSMRASLRDSKVMIPDADAQDHHDHHEDEAHLAHMEAETHEIEHVSHYARGRAGLHLLTQYHDETHTRRNGYTAPIEADLAVLLHRAHPQNNDNDDMKLGRPLDAIAADFDQFRDTMHTHGAVDVNTDSRFKRGSDGATLSA